MIYLLRKHDIISVPSYAEGIYHLYGYAFGVSIKDIISKIYHPFREERISLKKALPKKCFFLVEPRGISVRFQGLPLCSARSRLFAHSPVARPRRINLWFCFAITVPRTVFSRPSIPFKSKQKNRTRRFFCFGGAVPRLNSVDISGDFLAKLPKKEIKIPNPTFRVFIIGRKILNYCGNFGAEE